MANGDALDRGTWLGPGQTSTVLCRRHCAAISTMPCGGVRRKGSRASIHEVIAGICSGGFGSSDFHVRSVAKLAQDGLAVFPRQTKRADIGEAKPRYSVANDFEVSLLEVALAHRLFGPVHQFGQAEAMAEVIGHLLSNQLTCHLHSCVSSAGRWPRSTGYFSCTSTRRPVWS